MFANDTNFFFTHEIINVLFQTANQELKYVIE